MRREPSRVWRTPSASRLVCGAASLVARAIWSDPAAACPSPPASCAGAARSLLEAVAQLAGAAARTAQAALEASHVLAAPVTTSRVIWRSTAVRSRSTAGPSTASTPGSLDDALLEAADLLSRASVVIGPSVWKTTSNGVDQPAPRSRSNAS